MSERKLASIQRIDALEPIPGRDRIVLASILGWKTTVGKDDFQVGDLCVYFEVDSLLPVRPEFEFLRKSCWSEKQQGFHIRTMKMGGVYSQGLALPIHTLDLFVDKGDLRLPISHLDIGTDVTDLLGVKKYLTAEELEELRVPPPPKRYEWIPGWLWRLTKRWRRPTKRGWPSGIYKTDETRLQSMPGILEQMSGELLYATEKLDGCSATYFIRPKDRSLLDRLLFRKPLEFGVCSRNLRLYPTQKEKHNGGAYWEMAEKYELESKLRKFYKDFSGSLAIQGEIVGPGIQGNKYGLSERRFFVYQVQSEGVYAEYSVLKYLTQAWQLEDVPYLELPDFPITDGWSVDEWVVWSRGASVLNPEIPREGIVVRTCEDRRGERVPTVASRLSFKVINPEFLVKYEL